MKYMHNEHYPVQRERLTENLTGRYLSLIQVSRMLDEGDLSKFYSAIEDHLITPLYPVVGFPHGGSKQEKSDFHNSVMIPLSALPDYLVIQYLEEEVSDSLLPLDLVSVLQGDVNRRSLVEQLVDEITAIREIEQRHLFAYSAGSLSDITGQILEEHQLSQDKFERIRNYLKDIHCLDVFLPKPDSSGPACQCRTGETGISDNGFGRNHRLLCPGAIDRIHHILCQPNHGSYPKILNQIRTESETEGAALCAHCIHRPDTQEHLEAKALIRERFPDCPLRVCYGPYEHMVCPTDKGVIGEYENLTMRKESPYLFQNGSELCLYRNGEPVRSCTSRYGQVWFVSSFS
ncbi:MAG: hypothetical protein IJ088_07955, partial [Clostridia bacterium]|nr:hypothetical protein [Clostridia bacterium]